MITLSIIFYAIYLFIGFRLANMFLQKCSCEDWTSGAVFMGFILWSLLPILILLDIYYETL